MDVIESVDIAHARGAVRAVIADLATYPQWLSIVARVEPDGDAAWTVDLRAKLGPLTRSKRVRMRRVATDDRDHVRFDRDEIDGRSHSPWTLVARLTEPTAGTTRLTMHLHYGGRLWMPPLERILRDEIARSRVALGEHLDRAG